MFNIIDIALAHAGDEDTMGGNMMSYMWGLGNGWGWLAIILMGFFWLLVLVILILLIVWLIKQIQK